MMSITIRKELLFMIAAGMIAVYTLIKLKAARHNTGKLFDFKECVRIAMFLYGITLIGVTLFPIIILPIAEPYQMDFINWDIRNMFHFGSLRSLLVNIGGNVLMFVPLVPLVELNWPSRQMTFAGGWLVQLSSSCNVSKVGHTWKLTKLS